MSDTNNILSEFPKPPSIRAKFYVDNKQEFHYGDTIVTLRPVYSDDPKHENKAFWNATPSGNIEMSIKKEVADLLILGGEYYIDFTLASLPEKLEVG